MIEQHGLDNLSGLADEDPDSSVKRVETEEGDLSPSAVHRSEEEKIEQIGIPFK